MKNKTTLLASFVSFCLLLMSVNLISYGQITTNLEFSGSKKQVGETKKILAKYDIYFVLSDKEIKATYTKGMLLTIENITNDQIEQIINKEFVLVKLQDKKTCFYFMFSNEFVKSNVIKSLILYRVPKRKRIVGLFAVNKKSKALGSVINYSENGMSISLPLTLIPCSEYRGEFDKGLESYKNHREN